MSATTLRAGFLAAIVCIGVFLLLRRLGRYLEARAERHEQQRRVASLVADEWRCHEQHWEQRRLLESPKSNPFSVENIPYP